MAGSTGAPVSSGTMNSTSMPSSMPKKAVAAAVRRPVTCRVCGSVLFGGAERKLGRCADCPSDANEEVYGRLLEWRDHQFAAPQVPAN